MNHGCDRDGCEWCPDADRPSYGGDKHHETVRAEWMIGSGIPWRLCAECAKLPRFARYRVRRPIVRRAG